MTAPYVKKRFYCIAATEEPRLYEDCITIGNRFLYIVLPTCWQGASVVVYELYPQSQDVPATQQRVVAYYIGIRTISNAITRSHLARSYSKIGQKHLLNYSKFPLSNHSFENQTLSGIGPAFLKQLCSWAPVYPHRVFSFG